MPVRSTVWTALSKHQDAILRLAICALLVISALVVLFGWLASLDKLEIPLLFVGVCVITLGMLLVKGAPTVMLATLIVGYVVVPESYLLKLAHMITGPPTPIGEYTRPYGEEKVALDVGSIVERVLSEWETSKSEEKEALRKRVSGTLSGRFAELEGQAGTERSDVDEVVRQVLRTVQVGRTGDEDVLRNRINLAVDSEIAEFVDQEGASYPLGRIVRGESAELFVEHEEVKYYRNRLCTWLRSREFATRC